MKPIKLSMIMLIVLTIMSCMTLPNASNVKTPDAEISGCVMPNGTITDFYMFKTQNDGAYYSWYVINNMMQDYQNPILNFSSADKKAFSSLKPINRQGVFQNKYSAAELGELADYMKEHGYRCGFWHEIRGGNLVIAEVWTENNKDYMYRELVCVDKLPASARQEKINIVNAAMQQEQTHLQWIYVEQVTEVRQFVSCQMVTANGYGAYIMQSQLTAVHQQLIISR
ncbi:MAG: hypothetical protein J6U56_08770 [Spirochaetia bacterium]|nr:hypothetical protein [Spirochaetia bacterium]